MDDLHTRLERCFRAAFPKYVGTIDLIQPSATADWDSLATVTLLSLIQEEFNVEVGSEDLNHLNSFRTAQEFLRSRIDDAASAT